MAKKWFEEAVQARPPNTLGGWMKGQQASARRRKALASRPKNWSLDRKRRSAGRALQALANVTRDRRTEQVARQDARHFFSKLKSKRR